MDLAKQSLTSPFLAAIFALVCTLASLLGVQWLAVDADVAKALSSESETLENYRNFQERFELGLADEALLLRAEDFADQTAFDALENLVLDLQFVDGVAEVVSLFSVTGEGSTSPLIFAQPDVPLADRFEVLRDSSAVAQSLVTSDRSATLVHVIAERGTARGEIANAISSTVLTPAFDIGFVGQSAVERQIAANILRDQTVVTSLAVLLCMAVGLAVLRSVQAIVICAVPAICSVLWFLGAVGWAGQPLDPWLATLPTLVMVLAFADSLHLFYAAKEPGQSLEHAMRQVLPAAFLTSLTSALALASFAATGTDALIGLAVWGPVAMLCGFGAVALLFPVLARLLLRPNLPEPLSFRPITAWARSALARPAAMAGLAALILLGLLPTLNRAMPVFSVAEHVRADTPLGQDLAYMKVEGLGSSSLFVEVDDADGVPGLSEQDNQRLSTVAVVASGDAVEGPTAPSQVPERFRATDGLSTVVPVLLPLGLGAVDLDRQLDDLQQQLDAQGLNDVAHLTGQTLLAHQAVPETINAMRISFYIALGALVVVVGVSQRSLRLALLATGVSALPMLAIEAILVVSGAGMSMAVAFALVVAFGIAVDDAIHLLNQRRIAKGPEIDRLQAALTRAGPPMIASSVVMVVGFLATLFSAMASLPVFGLFVIFALLLALVIDLLLLPALILKTDR